MLCFLVYFLSVGTTYVLPSEVGQFNLDRFPTGRDKQGLIPLFSTAFLFLALMGRDAPGHNAHSVEHILPKIAHPIVQKSKKIAHPIVQFG